MELIFYSGVFPIEGVPTDHTGQLLTHGLTVEGAHPDDPGHLPQARPIRPAIPAKRLLRPLLPHAGSVPPAPDNAGA